ncbi:MAG: hypothetical protein ABI874_03320 [Chloroflexota bacterium]
MRTIEANASVTADGTLTLTVPRDIVPGEHRVVVVIDERPVAQFKRAPQDFPIIHVGAWPTSLSLRREDIHDDWGR